MLVSRSQVQSVERSKRAKVWAKEDDDLLAGASTSSPPGAPIALPTLSKPIIPSTASAAASSPPPPLTAALVGLTLLGNLDDIFVASSYPAIELTSFMAHTRKTQGKILISTHTFQGRLYLSLGWDAHGFRKGIVEEFWERVSDGVEEFLMDNGQTSHRL